MSDEANAPAVAEAEPVAAAEEADVEAEAVPAETKTEEAMEVVEAAAEKPKKVPAKKAAAKKAAAPKKAAAAKKAVAAQKPAAVADAKKPRAAKAAAAPAAAPAAPAPKPAKKESKPAASHSHPPYLDMAVAAIEALKERNGSSRQAILKYIMATFDVGTDPKVPNMHLKQALKRGVVGETLKNTKVSRRSGAIFVLQWAFLGGSSTPCTLLPPGGRATGRSNVSFFPVSFVDV